MTFEEFEANFLGAVLDTKPVYIRKGQALFNYLYEVRPGIADRVRASHIDPFYNDRHIAHTLNYAKEHWNDN